MVISAAVEGLVDEALVARLVRTSGGDTGSVYGKRGKSNLLERLGGFNAAARYSPWLVVVDLDSDFDCSPAALAVWLPAPAELMRFRIAVREAEAWILADRTKIAAFLGVSVAVVPRDPESLDNPKAALVNLARRSRRAAIREALVPREGSGRPVGAGYTGRVIEYVTTVWRPEVAATAAPSLQRALDALQNLIADEG